MSAPLSKPKVYCCDWDTHLNACCEDKIEITADETLKECDVL